MVEGNYHYRGNKKLLKATTQLGREVSDLIKPYEKQQDRPPFTTGELMVFALVQWNRDYLDESTILTWILEHFAYYARTASDSVEEYLKIHKSRFDIEKISEPIPGFFEALTNIDTPIDHVWKGEAYSLRLPDARGYLSRALYPNRKGHFRILDLPPEIRNRIYAMLFNYDTALTFEPAEGGDLFPKAAICRRLACSRSGPKTSPGSDERRLPERIGGWIVHVGSLDVALALVRTCRQIYHESKAVFYSTNTFYFRHEPLMVDTLLRMGDNSKYLRKVTLDFLHRVDIPNAIDERTARGWKVLSGLSLDSLVVIKPCSNRCYDKDFTEKGSHRTIVWKLPARLDRLVATAKRAKSVKIGYDKKCTTFKDYLLQKIQQKPTVKMLCCSVGTNDVDEKWF